MNNFLRRTIEYHIMAYKSKNGYMPNTILVPYNIYEEIQTDCEMYVTDFNGSEKRCGFNLMVDLDGKRIKPLRLLNNNK